VPLSFDWDGEALLVATPTDSPTGRNLAATRAVRLGLGHTRDVSMIDGEVEILEIDALPRSGVTGSPRAPASTRVRRPRRTAGSGSPRAEGGPNGQRRAPRSYCSHDRIRVLAGPNARALWRQFGRGEPSLQAERRGLRAGALETALHRQLGTLHGSERALLI
jgi:hypothetical protein